MEAIHFTNTRFELYPIFVFTKIFINLKYLINQEGSFI